MYIYIFIYVHYTCSGEKPIDEGNNQEIRLNRMLMVVVLVVVGLPMHWSQHSQSSLGDGEGEE